MPRGPRVLSQEGLYHVISRGNCKMKVFNQVDDYHYFLSKLSNLKEKYNFYLPCFCLMKTHFHLLIKTNKNAPLTAIMRSLLTSYSMRFNNKYERVGHVFQNRYKSFMVTTDPYLITLISYIHQNPTRAGYVENPSDYKFSSAKYYYQNHPSTRLVDTKFVIDLFKKELPLGGTVLD